MYQRQQQQQQIVLEVLLLMCRLIQQTGISTSIAAQA
jgi:hypothetical protein